MRDERRKYAVVVYGTYTVERVQIFLVCLVDKFINSII